MTKYRIHWKNKVSGHSGSLHNLFDRRKEAEEIAANENIVHPFYDHWVEAERERSREASRQ